MKFFVLSILAAFVAIVASSTETKNDAVKVELAAVPPPSTLPSPLGIGNTTGAPLSEIGNKVTGPSPKTKRGSGSSKSKGGSSKKGSGGGGSGHKIGNQRPPKDDPHNPNPVHPNPGSSKNKGKGKTN